MHLTKAKELRDERGRLYQQANAVLANDALSHEERTKQAEAIHADMAKLGALVAVCERQDALEVELRGSAAPPSGQPGGSDDPGVAMVRQERYKKAFHSYLLYGGKEEGSPAMRGRMNDEERRLVLSQYDRRDMGTGGQGAYPGATTGFLVPVGFVDQVLMAQKYYGPMLDGGAGMPTILETATGQQLPFPTSNDTAVKCELIGENQVVTTGDLVLSQTLFGAFKFSSKLIKVSIELLQDSGVDLEQLLIKAFAERFGRGLNTFFTTGAGTTEPMGIITAATSAGTAVGANANDGVSGVNSIGSDDLTTLEHSVDRAYRLGARYMMNDTVLAAIKKVKDKYGRPLWQPGIAVNAPDTINGYPYVANNDMDVLQTAASSPVVTRKAIAFGQLSKYMIRRVREMSVLRLEERFADYAQIAFIAFARYDGNLLDAGTHPVKYLSTVY